MDNVNVTYRWVVPDTGPAQSPEALATWVTRLPGTHRIACNRRDLPALQSTLLIDRVYVPQHGIVQPGTIWMEVAA